MFNINSKYNGLLFLGYFGNLAGRVFSRPCAEIRSRSCDGHGCVLHSTVVPAQGRRAGGLLVPLPAGLVL